MLLEQSDSEINIISYLKEIAPNAEGVFMEPSETVFEERVKMSCFYCGRFGNNWRCPPHLPNINYQKMFSEFSFGLFVVFKYDISDQNDYQGIRIESSVILHKTLLKLEKFLLNKNISTVLSFGAGSCKLCKTGCGKEKCNNPYLARSPLEATGCNVVKTAAKYGIDVKFPAIDNLMRIGLVLW